MRFQEAINRVMPRKKIKKKPETKLAETPKSNLVLQSDVSKVGDHEASTAPLRVQEQLLDDETRALQVIFGWMYIMQNWLCGTIILC
jgi:syntaxin 18